MYRVLFVSVRLREQFPRTEQRTFLLARARASALSVLSILEFEARRIEAFETDALQMKVQIRARENSTLSEILSKLSFRDEKPYNRSLKQREAEQLEELKKIKKK